jgi:Glycine zipper 2TM domain
MRTKLLIAGFMMAVALPATALAQPYDPGCVQQNRDNRVAGTVVGAIGGALIGSAIGGRHNSGAGAVIGGVTGAAAGNAIAGSNNHPCPSGYYYAPPPPQPGYYPPQPQPGYGGPGYGSNPFWNGAPTGVHQRIDYMQTRITSAYSYGRISPRQSADANRELTFIRSEDRRLRYQSGGHLRPEDRDYLQGRLDNLGQRLNWFARTGY